MIRHLIKYLAVLIPMLALISCKDSGIFPISQLIKDRGSVALVAKDFEMHTPRFNLPVVSFFGLVDDFRKNTHIDMVAGEFLILTNDTEFSEQVDIYYKTKMTPEKFSGSTMFAPLGRRSSDITVARIIDRNTCEVIYEGNPTIFYFEEGLRDHVIRRPSKP